MKTKLFSIFNLLIISTLSCFAQQDKSASSLVRDTVFVYDTLYVTDTIFIKKPPVKRINMETLPTLSTPSLEHGIELADTDNFLIFSADGTATLFENSIINANNINQSEKNEAMKKLKFIGLMVFAFQNMVLAQHDIGINIGSGIHYLNSTYQNTASATDSFYQGSSFVKPSLNIGVNYRADLIADKLSVQTGLNYHFLPATNFDTLDIVQSEFSIHAFRDNEVFTENYHLFTLPVGLYFKTQRFSSGIGVEGYIKRSSTITRIYNTDDGNGNISPQEHSYTDVYAGASIFGAVQLHLSKRLDLNLKYSTGLTKELVADYNGFPFSTKMQRIDMGLRYQLGQKSKED